MVNIILIPCLQKRWIFVRPREAFPLCTNKKNRRTRGRRCGSGSELDSMGSLDPYPDHDSQSGSGFRRTKMTHKHGKKLINYIFLLAGCSLLRAKVFSCSLDISKLQFMSKNFFICIFFLFSSVFGHQNPVHSSALRIWNGKASRRLFYCLLTSWACRSHGWCCPPRSAP